MTKKTTKTPSFAFKWDSTAATQKPKVFARVKRLQPDGPKTIGNIAGISAQQKDENTKLEQKISEAAVKRLLVKPVASNPIPPPKRDSTNDDPRPTLKGHVRRNAKKQHNFIKEELKKGNDSALKQQQHQQSKAVSTNYSLFNEREKEVYVRAQVGKSVHERLFADESFEELGVHGYIISNLNNMLITKPTTVQAKTIPVAFLKKNILVRSQTGSGKTLSYVIPIVNLLVTVTPKIKRTDGVLAVVVVPTRELAQQVFETFTKINTFQWIVATHLCGGENRKSEKDRLRKGINILIGTPGRLLDHVRHTTCLKLDRVEFLVLDEADRLLDMGFRLDIIRLVEAIDQAKTNSSYDPMSILKGAEQGDTESKEKVKRQTMLLSATLTEGVSELANFAMKDHVYVDALDESLQQSNVLLDSFIMPESLKQKFLLTYVKHRLFTLAGLLLTKCESNGKILVFMASGAMVDYHYALFTKCLLPLISNEDGSIQFFKLHGSMDQKERQRVFASFRKSRKGVLICTDVAARGVDVPHADCIIQYSGPQSNEDYLHRVGRTGRAGQSGETIIFLTHDEQKYVAHLQEHRVFLLESNADSYLEILKDVMNNRNQQEACTALQGIFEEAVDEDNELKKLGYFAYSSWSKFYNSYPSKMRAIFNFKNCNQGHYVTSFALKETPTGVSKVVKEHVTHQAATIPPKRLNKKLANHNADELPRRQNSAVKKEKVLQNKTRMVTMSEFSDGLSPLKKRKK